MLRRPSPPTAGRASPSFCSRIAPSRHAHPEQVRAFLRMNLRVVDVMRKQGAEAFVDDYVRFNKTWAQRPLSREEALEDLRIHFIFTLDEQLALVHSQAGRLRDWLRGIIGFYGTPRHPEPAGHPQAERVRVPQRLFPQGTAILRAALPKGTLAKTISS
ncbi:MAG: hypothetical protein V8Q84_03460 [Bilophila sp.]